MADVLHRIGVERSSPAQVYDALTTVRMSLKQLLETGEGAPEPRDGRGQRLALTPPGLDRDDHRDDRGSAEWHAAPPIRVENAVARPPIR